VETGEARVEEKEGEWQFPHGNGKTKPTNKEPG